MICYEHTNIKLYARIQANISVSIFKFSLSSFVELYVYVSVTTEAYSKEIVSSTIISECRATITTVSAGNVKECDVESGKRKKHC